MKVRERPKIHERMREEILGGPLRPALLKLAWPTATTSALQGLVAAVDVIMVGHLGSRAVAATTASNQAVMLLMVAGNALGIGGATLVAQAVGAGDRDRANSILTQCLLSFALILLLVVLPVGWALTPLMLGGLVKNDPGVMAVGVPYMRVLIGTSFFTVMGFAAGGAVRGAGDTRTPLRIALLTNVVHVPANYVMIFGLPHTGFHGLGVVGAAWGTMLARAWMNCLLLGWLATGRLPVRLLGLRRWRLEPALLWEMARIGIPASLSGIVLNLNGVALFSILSRTSAGALATAAYGMANTFRNFATWMTWGLSDATVTMVGQNIGARQRRRARAAGFAAAEVAAAFMFGMGLLVALVAPHVFPAVLKEPDPLRKAEVIRLATQFLWTQVFALPLLGVGMSLEGALRGAGDTMAAMLNNAVSFLLIGIPLCGLLALHGHLGPVVVGLGLGPLGVWLGLGTAMASRGLFMLYKWRRARWRARVL